MELIPGVTKEDYSDYVLYYIENFSDELKSEIRSRLVSICHGAEHAQSTRVIYSYKYTLKEFIKRYKTNQDASDLVPKKLNNNITKNNKNLIFLKVFVFICALYDFFKSYSPF